jgi:hypothetical protein
MNIGDGLIVVDGIDPDPIGRLYAVMPPSTARTAPVV